MAYLLDTGFLYSLLNRKAQSMEVLDDLGESSVNAKHPKREE